MKADDIIAAEYVLGLARGDERRAIEARLDTDADLQSRIERWQTDFAPLDAGGREAPPAGLFETMLARIDAAGTQLPGTTTQRAAAADWLKLSPGVTYRVLREDRVLGRRSLLIRMEPGAIYQSHAHDDDEECLVIEGDLRFGDLDLRGGDFHVAHKGMVHPVASTVSGCLLHITAGLH